MFANDICTMLLGAFTCDTSIIDYLELECIFYMLRIQCFDAVGWAAGRATGLLKTEWWDVSGSRCRFAYAPVDATATHYLLLQ